MPCDVMPFGPYEVDEEKCIADREKQHKYLDPTNYGAFHTFFMYNAESFDAQYFDERAIRKVSRVTSLLISPTGQ